MKSDTLIDEVGNVPMPSSPVPKSSRVNSGAMPSISQRVAEVRFCNDHGLLGYARVKRDPLPDDRFGPLPC